MRTNFSLAIVARLVGPGLAQASRPVAQAARRRAANASHPPLQFTHARLLPPQCSSATVKKRANVMNSGFGRRGSDERDQEQQHEVLGQAPAAIRSATSEECILLVFVIHRPPTR